MPSKRHSTSSPNMDPFYLALLLYVAAVVLAMVDLFVPSGGMLIILASVAAVACVLFGFRSSTGMGMSMLTLVTASIPAFAVAAIRIWPKTPIGRRIILSAPSAARPAAQTAVDESLLGIVVTAEYPLMPSGQIRIRGQRRNASTQSGLVEAGQNVKIVGIKDRNLIVEVTDEECTPVPAPTTQEPSEDAQASEGGDNLLDLPADELGLDSID